MQHRNKMIANVAPVMVMVMALAMAGPVYGAPTLTGTNPPDQIHLAFAGVDANGFPNGMAVMWATANPTATSTVRYGLSPGNLTSTAVGSFKSYLPVRRLGMSLLTSFHYLVFVSLLVGVSLALVALVAPC